VGEIDLEIRLEKISKLENAKAIEIAVIEKEFTKLLCPKGKKECEPAYCSLRIANECPFLEKWHILVKKYNLSPP